MASSKYDRELRFIDTECRRLKNELDDLREMMPQSPLDAEKKAVDIGLIEERMGELLTRKKEIEDSFIAAGLEIPNIHNDLNANGCRDSASYDDGEKAAVAFVGARPERDPEPKGGLDALSAEVSSITDELMQIEIKMLQADLADDDSEKQKHEMSTNALRSRRDDLVAEIKAMKSAPKEEAPKADNAFEDRVAALEADNRAIRSQISMVRSDVSEIKDQLRQILEALNQDF